MTGSHQNVPGPIRDSKVWFHMIMLSLVSLGGMVALMVIIIWQMHGNIIEERKHLIHSQVVSALSMSQRIYDEYQRGNLSETEAKHHFISHIGAMKYPEDGYFWIINDEGVMLMHPYSQELIGKSTIDIRDTQGRHFVRDFIAAARAGGNFVTYEWPRPGGGEAAAKLAYVMPFKPWNWVVGSGLYIDDLEAAALQQISMGGILIFILFIIDIAISLHLSKRCIYEFRETAIHDVLTDLFTRRYLDEVGARMMARSEIDDAERLAAIFFDLDHFKQVNDTYGHKTGDVVLSTVGQIMKQQLRPNELAFRYGGEEMVVLLNTSENNCRVIAERIRATVSDHDFMIAGHKFKVTLSAGIAIAQPNESLADLLRRADACLYTAKKRGRDRTVTESEMKPVAG